MTLAYRIIRSEHFEMDLVMRCLGKLAEALREETWEPDFELLALMLDYVESFPATCHHPKEEDYLFKALRRRAPESEETLERLCGQHADGLDLVSGLRRGLEAYREDAGAKEAFCDAAARLARHERDHIKLEERKVLPLALQALTKEDWEEIDAAFAANESPLLNDDRRAEFDKLFALILRMVPGAVVFKPKEVKRKRAA